MEVVAQRWQLWHDGHNREDSGAETAIERQRLRWSHDNGNISAAVMFKRRIARGGDN